MPRSRAGCKRRADVGNRGVKKGCRARAPGAPTSSSASLKWPPATPFKPPTRSHQSAPRGLSPPDMARAPGALTTSSASHKWPQATPLKPPTRSPQSAPRGRAFNTARRDVGVPGGGAEPVAMWSFSSEIRGLSVSETANDNSFTESTLVAYSFEEMHQGEANGLKMHRKAVF